MNMRKSALFLVVLAIVLSLNGCSQTSANRYSPSYSPDSAPNNKTYNFTSYDDLCKSLNKRQSSLRQESRRIDYGTNYNNYLTVFDYKGSTIKVPTYDNVPMTIEGNAEWHKITLFTEELYGLPWLWFYCKYQDSTIVVCTTYYDLLGISETNKALNFEEILNTIIPDAPSPNNFEKYIASYDSISKQTLTLSGSRTVFAVVFDSATSARVHYRFVYDDMIVSVWMFEGGEISDEFWNHFGLNEYE